MRRGPLGRLAQTTGNLGVSMDTPSEAALLEDVIDLSATISEGERACKEDTAASPTNRCELVATR